MRQVGICTVAIVISFFIVLPSHAFFNSDVKKAKKFMSAQMYPQAIELLTKRINEKPTDEDAHFLLAECSLYTGNYREASKRFDSAVNLKPELKEQAAQTCLKVEKGVDNVSKSSRILSIAEQYAVSQDTKEAIGKKELLLSRQSSGGMQKTLKQRAAKYLGEAEVYGFEKIKLSANKFKIVFHTEKPVSVLEWKKGVSIVFIEVSNPDKVKRYYSKHGKAAKVGLGKSRTANSTISLEFLGNEGEFVIYEIQKQ